MSSDTIAAIATAPGKAGIAVVRVSGPEAFAIAERLTGREVKPGRITYRVLKEPDSGKILDEAVVLAFKGPKSYTGEDVIEFQGHGGSVVPRRILEATFALGARLAGRGEFTERAFLNGRITYDQAEGVLDLINSRTDEAADSALQGLKGERQRELKSFYEEAIAISTELEHALDIDEGELPEDFLPRIKSEITALKLKLKAMIECERRSRLMREGIVVVLAGAPNAGKSSLMNALLKENRAIVSDTPGTTRDSIEAWINLGGYPVRLIDTAGLRESDDQIESEGVKRAEKLIKSADLVIGLDLELEHDSGLELDLYLKVHSKCDLSRGEGLNVSAVTGEGLEELKAELIRRFGEIEIKDPSQGGIDRLIETSKILEESGDIVLMANAVRSAAERLGSIVGATYSTDLLDRLFSRFCVGK